MSVTGIKKNTSEHYNTAFSKEIEGIYNIIAEESGMSVQRDFLLEQGMLEWLKYFINSTGDCERVFRIKPVSGTSKKDLIVLFANMMEVKYCGIL